MDLAGYLVKAVVVEGRSVTEVAAAHGVSRSWLYETIHWALADDLAAEVAALEADDADREEMLAMAGLMEALRAPG